MYHYTESGLSNIWLVNGYAEHDTPYGDGASIENVDGLHAAIGDMIVSATGPLSGEQIKFLRHELGCSQKRIGALLDVDSQTVARWEKDQTAISGPADRLIRSYYKQKISGNVDVANVLEHLADADAADRVDRHHLQNSDLGWREADREAA